MKFITQDKFIGERFYEIKASKRSIDLPVHTGDYIVKTKSPFFTVYTSDVLFYYEGKVDGVSGKEKDKIRVQKSSSFNAYKKETFEVPDYFPSSIFKLSQTEAGVTVEEFVIDKTKFNEVVSQFERPDEIKFDSSYYTQVGNVSGSTAFQRLRQSYEDLKKIKDKLDVCLASHLLEEHERMWKNLADYLLLDRAGIKEEIAKQKKTLNAKKKKEKKFKLSNEYTSSYKEEYDSLLLAFEEKVGITVEYCKAETPKGRFKGSQASEFLEFIKARFLFNRIRKSIISTHYPIYRGSFQVETGTAGFFFVEYDQNTLLLYMGAVQESSSISSFPFLVFQLINNVKTGVLVVRRFASESNSDVPAFSLNQEQLEQWPCILAGQKAYNDLHKYYKKNLLAINGIEVKLDNEELLLKHSDLWIRLLAKCRRNTRSDSIFTNGNQNTKVSSSKGVKRSNSNYNFFKSNNFDHDDQNIKTNNSWKINFSLCKLKIVSLNDGISTENNDTCRINICDLSYFDLEYEGYKDITVTYNSKAGLLVKCFINGEMDGMLVGGDASGILDKIMMKNEELEKTKSENQEQKSKKEANKVLQRQSLGELAQFNDSGSLQSDAVLGSCSPGSGFSAKS